MSRFIYTPKAVAKMGRKKRKTSVARLFHRSIGAGAALFVLFMVLSGLAINHTNGLGLDQRKVSLPFLLNWYGLGEPEHIHSYATGGDWLSFAGSQLYLNGNPVSTLTNGVGAVFNGEILIAAGSDEMLLLDGDGNLIERLPWDTPGTGLIETIGLLQDGTVAVQSADKLWLADAQLLSWQQSGGTVASPLWSSAQAAPDEMLKDIKRQYRGDGLNMEQLILDFHSGHIFGPLGVLVYDLLALAVGFLAISGLVLWIRGRGNGKRNR